MSSLSDIEFLVLDEVYFVSSFQTILQNTGYNEEQLRKTLADLLEKGFIAQMKYNEELKDYEKLDQPDLFTISHSSFVATREGLAIHNSRN